VFSKKWKDEKVRSEAARRRVGKSGPHSRSRVHIGPFRRNAERAAICPAMKIKHRIVPISSFPEVLHVPGEAPGSGGYARVLATSAVYLKILARESGFDKDIRELTDFFYRSLLKDDSTLVASHKTQRLSSINSINDIIIYFNLSRCARTSYEIPTLQTPAARKCEVTTK